MAQYLTDQELLDGYFAQTNQTPSGGNRRQSDAELLTGYVEAANVGLMGPVVREAPKAPAKPIKRGFFGEALSAAGSGLVRIPETIAGTAEMMGVPGAETSRKGLQEWLQSDALRASDDLTQGNVIDRPDYLVSPRWWVRTLGENLPNAVAMIAPGYGAMRAARAADWGVKAIRHAALAGGLSGSFVFESGSAYTQAKDEMKLAGIYDDDTVEKIATLEGLTAGVANSIIEMIPFENLFLKQAGADRLLRRLVRQAFLEGSTETVQEGVNILVETLGHKPPPELKEGIARALESGLVGGAIGGIFGGTIGTVQHNRAAKFYNGIADQLGLKEDLGKWREESAGDEKQVVRNLDSRLAEIRKQTEAMNKDLPEDKKIPELPEIDAKEMAGFLMPATHTAEPGAELKTRVMGYFGMKPRSNASTLETGTGTPGMTDSANIGKDIATEGQRARNLADQDKATVRIKGQDLFDAAITEVNEENNAVLTREIQAREAERQQAEAEAARAEQEKAAALAQTENRLIVDGAEVPPETFKQDLFNLTERHAADRQTLIKMSQKDPERKNVKSRYDADEILLKERLTLWDHWKGTFPGDAALYEQRQAETQGIQAGDLVEFPGAPGQIQTVKNVRDKTVFLEGFEQPVPREALVTVPETPEDRAARLAPIEAQRQAEKDRKVNEILENVIIPKLSKSQAETLRAQPPEVREAMTAKNGQGIVQGTFNQILQGTRARLGIEEAALPSTVARPASVQMMAGKAQIKAQETRSPAGTEEVPGQVPIVEPGQEVPVSRPSTTVSEAKKTEPEKAAEAAKPWHRTPAGELVLSDMETQLVTGEGKSFNEIEGEYIITGSGHAPWYRGLSAKYGNAATSPTGKKESISAAYTANVIRKGMAGEELTDTQTSLWQDIQAEGKRLAAQPHYQRMVEEISRAEAGYETIRRIPAVDLRKGDQVLKDGLEYIVAQDTDVGDVILQGAEGDEITIPEDDVFDEISLEGIRRAVISPTESTSLTPVPALETKTEKPVPEETATVTPAPAIERRSGLEKSIFIREYIEKKDARARIEGRAATIPELFKEAEAAWDKNAEEPGPVAVPVETQAPPSRIEVAALPSRVEPPITEMSLDETLASKKLLNDMDDFVHAVTTKGSRVYLNKDLNYEGHPDLKKGTLATVYKPTNPMRLDRVAIEYKDGKGEGITIAVPSSALDPLKVSVVEKPAAAIPNTEDAGAELTYNKRNRIRTGIKWEDIADKNTTLKVKETTKQNVYPKPDYEEMIRGGMAPLPAHIVKQVYDSLAVSPATAAAPTDADLQLYIDAVNRVMDGTQAWVSNDEAISKWAEKQAAMAGAALGRGAVSITDMAQSGKELLETVYPDGWRNHREEVKLLGGNRLLRALQPGMEEGKKAVKAIKEGWPAKQDAWQKQGYAVAESDKVATVKEGYRYTDGTTTVPQYYVAINNRSQPENYATREEAETARNELAPWLLLDKANRIKGQYDTEETAIEAAREGVKRESKDKISDKGISVEAAERVGETRRMEDEDITSDRLRETFDFKGVNFGNWMKGDTNTAERQLHLNHAYDSFMDLAEILGVPPKAMSLNGMLGVAIGAQGTGAYAAHFVPGVNEINLTRTSGAGSLAHEFGHAVDHYFATQAGLAAGSPPFLTEHTENVDADGYTKRGGQKVKAFGEGIRPEIVAHYRNIVAAMNKRQTTPEEIAARRQTSREKAKKNIEWRLRSIRTDYGGMLEEFNRLANRITALDLGEGLVSIGGKSYVSPVVAEMRDLYKKEHGRPYSIENIKALQANIDHLVYLNSEKATEQDHAPQTTMTDYSAAAAKLDKEKGGKRYWNTDVEKFARAFDAYVSDTLEEKAAKNTYLSHAGREGETVPVGVERVAINSAIGELIKEIKTRETVTGVEMYSVEGRLPSERTRGIPETAGEIITSHHNNTKVAAHQDYKAAKGGARAAAARLVTELINPETVDQAKKRFGEDVIYVAPHAEETTGRNQIPNALANLYAEHTGGTVDENIVQSVRSFHTGAGAMERLISRVSFDGDVVKGGRYVLVDDVTTAGGTLAELAHHIQEQGGEVAGIITLTNASRTAKITPDSQLIREIERRHGNEVRELFGIEPKSLTAAEAGYLVGFRDADSLRHRAAKARQERIERLLSKGIRPSEAAVTPAESETHQPAGLGEIPLKKLVEDLARTVKGIEIIPGPDGTSYIKTKNDRLCRVVEVSRIDPDEVALQLAYGAPALKAGLAIAGSTERNETAHTIKLVRDKAGFWTLTHEFYHFLEDIGAVDKADRAVLNNKIAALIAKDPANYGHLQGRSPAEARADWVGKTLAGVYDAKTTTGKILGKIRDVVDRILNALGIRTAAGVLRDIRTGEIYDQKEGKPENMRREGAQYSTQQSIRELVPVVIIGNEFYPFDKTGEPFDMKAARESALSYARKEGVIGVVENANDGKEIIVSAKGIREALSHESGPQKIQIVAGLTDILRDAVPVTNHVNHENATITDYIYAGKAKLEGEEYVVGIVTHEDTNGNRFYDHELTTIEKLDAIPSQAGAAPVSGVGRPSRRASVLDYIRDVFVVKPENMTPFRPPEGGGRPEDQYALAEDVYREKVAAPVGKKISASVAMLTGKIPEANLASLERFRQHWHEFWRPFSTLPQGEKALAARYAAMGNVARAVRFIEGLHKQLDALPDAVKKDLFWYLDGSIPLESLAPEYHDLARMIRTRTDAIGQMLVEKGLLAEEQFKAHEGQYIHYMYARHVLGEDAPLGIAGTGKLDLTYTKSRNPNMTLEQRRALGLIEDASVAVPVGMGKALSDIAKADYLATIAANPEWVWQPSMVSVPIGKPKKDGKPKLMKMGIGKLVEEEAVYAKMVREAPSPEVTARYDVLHAALEKAKEETANVPADYVQLPTSKSYGSLAGAFVRQAIADDLMPVFGSIGSAQSMGKLARSFIEIEQTAMATFKMGKVALNLPTACRNVLSNVLQVNMSGRALHKIPGDVIAALESMKAKDAHYEEAFGMGLFHTNWFVTEINAVLDAFRKAQGGRFDKLMIAVKDVAKYYGKIDDVFKMALFLQQRKEGKPIDEAILHAMKWGMDYSLASRSIKTARLHLLPFSTYQYKIAPLIAESLKKRPWVIGKFAMALPILLEAMAKSAGDLDDEDLKDLQRQLPAYIKKSGSMMILPWKTDKGQWQWLNAEYFFPWGNWYNIFRDVGKGDIGELTRDVGITNPLLDILSTFRSARDGSPPNHPFFGTPIYNDLDHPALKAAKLAEHLAFTFLPSMLSPSQGALGTTLSGLAGKEDRWGKEVTFAQAFGKWFGFNIVAVSPDQTAAMVNVKLQDLKKEIARIEADPSISDERKAAARQRLRDRQVEFAGNYPEAVLPIGKQKGDDPVFKALTDMLGKGILKAGPPTRSIEIAGVPVKMSLEQYRDYREKSGEIVHRKLLDLVTSPAWAAMPDKRKTEVVSGIVENARKGVRQRIKWDLAKEKKAKDAASGA